MKRYIVVKMWVFTKSTSIIQQVDNKQDAIDFVDILIRNEADDKVKYAVYEQLVAED